MILQFIFAVFLLLAPISELFAQSEAAPLLEAFDADLIYQQQLLQPHNSSERQLVWGLQDTPLMSSDAEDSNDFVLVVPDLKGEAAVALRYQGGSLQDAWRPTFFEERQAMRAPHWQSVHASGSESPITPLSLLWPFSPRGGMMMGGAVLDTAHLLREIPSLDIPNALLESGIDSPLLAGMLGYQQQAWLETSEIGSELFLGVNATIGLLGSYMRAYAPGGAPSYGDMDLVWQTNQLIGRGVKLLFTENAFDVGRAILWDPVAPYAAQIWHNPSSIEAWTLGSRKFGYHAFNLAGLASLVKGGYYATRAGGELPMANAMTKEASLFATAGKRPRGAQSLSITSQDIERGILRLQLPGGREALLGGRYRMVTSRQPLLSKEYDAVKKIFPLPPANEPVRGLVFRVPPVVGADGIMTAPPIFVVLDGKLAARWGTFVMPNGATRFGYVSFRDINNLESINRARIAILGITASDTYTPFSVWLGIQHELNHFQKALAAAREGFRGHHSKVPHSELSARLAEMQKAHELGVKHPRWNTPQQALSNLLKEGAYPLRTLLEELEDAISHEMIPQTQENRFFGMIMDSQLRGLYGE